MSRSLRPLRLLRLSRSLSCWGSWIIFEVLSCGFFFWTKNRVSQGLIEFIWDHSLLTYFWNWKGISDFYSLVWVKEKKFGSILKEKFSISGVPTTLQVKLDRQRNLTLKSRPLVWPQLWSDIGPEYVCVKYFLSFPQKKLSSEKTETNYSSLYIWTAFFELACLKN